MTTIYVGNIPFDATENDVRVLFEKHGSVESVTIISDRETGKPRGFAFVDLSACDIHSAVQQMNGSKMGGRPLRVSPAREQAPRPSNPHTRN